MKAVIFSDIHNDRAALERLMSIDADAYFCAGDLVSSSGKKPRGLAKMGEAMGQAMSTLVRRSATSAPDLRSGIPVYVLPGNHESAKDIETFCADFGFVNFHGATLELSGVRFAGLGYSTPTPFDTPGEWTEAHMAQHLNRFDAYKPDVLICHAPPLNTALDRIQEGLHAGSQAVRDFIEHHQPAHFFCGHIHEAEGVVIQMGRTRAMNVGKQGYELKL